MVDNFVFNDSHLTCYLKVHITALTTGVKRNMGQQVSELFFPPMSRLSMFDPALVFVQLVSLCGQVPVIKCPSVNKRQGSRPITLSSADNVLRDQVRSKVK
ncbi:hypothetical protein BgiBS90_007315, partial [Biomphalaria glabrata]